MKNTKIIFKIIYYFIYTILTNIRLYLGCQYMKTQLTLILCDVILCAYNFSI